MPNLTPQTKPATTAPARPSSAVTSSLRPQPAAPTKPVQSILYKPPTRPMRPPPPPPRPTPSYPKGLVRALYIGVNYETIPQVKLNGCINDANNLYSFIKKNYSSCKDHRIITDATSIKPTKKNVVEAIQWLVKDLKAGQSVFFHYSGHGGRIPDFNQDEISGLDSCIYPYEGGALQPISDDELRSLLADTLPAGTKCFAVLDCCHSGTAMDLRYNWQCNTEKKLTFEQNEKYAKTSGSVIFLSGCEDVQYAMDTVNAAGVAGGALTNALLDVWTTYKVQIKIKHLLWDVRKYLKDRNYEQIPQLSSGLQVGSEDVLNL